VSLRDRGEYFARVATEETYPIVFRTEREPRLSSCTEVYMSIELVAVEADLRPCINASCDIHCSKSARA
jgi:hypothetical protein